MKRKYRWQISGFSPKGPIAPFGICVDHRPAIVWQEHLKPYVIEPEYEELVIWSYDTTDDLSKMDSATEFTLMVVDGNGVPVEVWRMKETSVVSRHIQYEDEPDLRQYEFTIRYKKCEYENLSDLKLPPIGSTGF